MKKSVFDSRTPFFSICIPVYNAERYLRECLESVLRQSETDYEAILVDDGSEDGGAKICDEYATRYPGVFRAFHKKNEGPLIARDYALRNARGRYFMFLDSDDVYSPDALRKVREAIETRRADMVLFDFRRFSSGGLAKRETLNYDDGEIFEGEGKRRLYEMITSEAGCLNNVWSKCAARELYDFEIDYSKYKDLKYGEDKLVALVFLDRAKRIVYVKEPLYGYRFNSQSTTVNYSFEHYKNIEIVYERESEYVERWNLSPRSIALQKRRFLIYACNAATFSYRNLTVGKITRAEFKEIIAFIVADEKFREAYASAGRLLSLGKRTICRLILKENVGMLSVFLRLRGAGRKKLR